LNSQTKALKKATGLNKQAIQNRHQTMVIAIKIVMEEGASFNNPQEYYRN